MKYDTQANQKVNEMNARIEPITRDHINALKEAETIIPEFYWDRGQPKSQIRAIQSVTRYGQTHDFTVEIPVKYSFDAYFNNSGIDHQERPTRCTAYLSHQNTTYNNAYRDAGAVAHLLRAGDLLTVEWIFNNSNQYTGQAGLLTYTCNLIIERGKKRLSIMLDNVTMPNNTASPIKFY